VVSDIGGATANMWHMVCTDEAWHARCRRASCVYPSVCEKFGTDHGPLIQLMRKARELPGVKRAFVASGIRYDVAFADEKHGDEYIRELVANHVGGHLKIAPEHISPGVVKVMKKPAKEMFVRFKELFEKYSVDSGKEQYLVPYFISAIRLRGEGHGGVVRLPGGERVAPAAGTGLHAHADDASHGHVLLGFPPEQRQAGAHPEGRG